MASYTKLNMSKKCMDRFLFPNVNYLGLQVSVHFKNIFEDKKFSINSNQWENLLRPYQHYVMGR